jgi:RNA polymerase sigma-70 factor, ECF subfamily
MSVEHTAVSSETLVELVAAGDVAAYEALYALVTPRVYGLSLRLTRDAAMAEEVAQEVLLTLWRESTRYDPARGSAIGWVLTLTHRRAVDRIRQVEAARARDDRYRASHHLVDTDVTTETALSSVEGERVQRVLAALKPQQREAITLAYFDGLTHAEVAARLEIPLGTAKTRIRDALISLRTRLQPATAA